MSLSLNPKYILLRNILSNCLLVYLAPGFFSRSRPNRPVQTDPAQVELAHSTLPLKLNLRFLASPRLANDPRLVRFCIPRPLWSFGFRPLRFQASWHFQWACLLVRPLSVPSLPRWGIYPSCGRSRLFNWERANSRRQERVEVRTKIGWPQLGQSR